ncbi:hypothetical protein C0995_007117 [Termitomyces sp. Mi166|nr:hypothetical protein C0995_007117 [Termitomyces sp. Mi166\
MPSSTTSRKRSRSFSPPEFRPRRPPSDSSRLLNTNRHTLIKIDRLMFELQSVRGYIEGNLGRETSIISELETLGHSVPPRESSQEIALREKLQALQSQLEAETRMRIEAETALTDFQKECREPFLVPALYDVVEAISRLTTQVVGRIQQEAGAGG